ncbi:hypothetical protein Pcinc_042917 [Petrolisthes cinctipes]|uniref:Uncharacterized protein n=1 Tax=Petrolisthes cinctipes TaxID=88211 RepID=A0AAE1BK73_PETCI|nr:hypothetical protein Pcinc_042917 [Petrolisthes cinctipes]
MIEGQRGNTQRKEIVNHLRSRRIFSALWPDTLSSRPLIISFPAKHVLSLRALLFQNVQPPHMRARAMCMPDPLPTPPLPAAASSTGLHVSPVAPSGNSVTLAWCSGSLSPSLSRPPAALLVLSLWPTLLSACLSV